MTDASFELLTAQIESEMMNQQIPAEKSLKNHLSSLIFSWDLVKVSCR